MTRIALCVLLLCACSSTETDTHNDAIETGVLENPAFGAASGLARAAKHDDRLWVINDGGSEATLYAIGQDGSDHGEVRLTGVNNVDWEDLAAFEFDGRPKLLIADVGDNLGLRDRVTLYVVDEPGPGQSAAEVSWQVSLRYPDGPRDVEAVSVDATEGLVYLLAKRTIPAELYSVRLQPAMNDGTAVISATLLGTIESIPQPTDRDRSRALIEQNWHWQPTAMAFSADRKLAVILTYRAIYLYSRQGNELWFAALQRPPRVFVLDGIKEAESVTLVGNSIFVTVEAAHAPIYRINFER